MSNEEEAREAIEELLDSDPDAFMFASISDDGSAVVAKHDHSLTDGGSIGVLAAAILEASQRFDLPPETIASDAVRLARTGTEASVWRVLGDD